MDIFKKNKGKQEERRAEPPAEPPVASPPPVAPDSPGLAEARQKAEEHIRLIEQKIAREREEWANKVKEKEEESIALKAHLEMIIQRASQEREKRESRLNLLKNQAEHDLAEIEKELEQEIVSWNERLADKEKEIDTARQQGVFAEAQKKLEADENIRTLKTLLDQAEQKSRSLERQLLEEQQQWIAKLKVREEEIINVRTQISLREARTRSEEEKGRTTDKERESMWQEQVRELEARLEAQRTESTAAYRQREEELIGLRVAFEQRLAVLALETDKKEKELHSLTARVEERIRAVEHGIEEERAKWQEMLKGRENELSRVKAELLLRESQEKADDERRAQEFKAAETLTGRKLDDIRKKIEEEKGSWLKTLAGKEEEIKLFTLQAEFKLKELFDAAEQRKTAVAREKEERERKLEELGARFAEEKRMLQSELAAKTDAVTEYQKECQEKQRQAIVRGEAALLEMKQRNESLEQEAIALETELQQEKARWQASITRKEKELETLRAEMNAREGALRNEQAAAEAKLRSEQQPLAAQIKDTENRLLSLRNRHAVEMAAKESQIQSLREQGKRQEEVLRKRIAFQADRLREAEGAIQKKIEEIKAQHELQSHQASEMLAQLEEKEGALRGSFVAESEKATRERHRIAQHYEQQKAELLAAVGNLEKEYRETEEQLTKELGVRLEEAAAEERNLKAREENARQELASLVEALASQEARGKEETARAQEESAAERERLAVLLREKERAVEDLKRALRDEKIRYQKEIEALRTDLRGETQPLADRRQELETLLQKEKRLAEEKCTALEMRAASLREQQANGEAAFQAMKAELLAKLAGAREKFQADLEALDGERTRAESEAQALLSQREEEAAAVGRATGEAREGFAAQREALRKEAALLKQRLTEEIAQLEKDIVHLESEYPKLIETRQEEIAVLEKQLREKALFYEKQADQAEKSLENFQRRAERRMAQLRLQTEQAADRHQHEYAVADQRLNELRAEHEQQEKLQNEELAREGKIFAEEKYRLEKQKGELEEKLKDLQFISREQLRQKEKEILALQNELAEKEKGWEAAWQQKERELAAERTLIVQEMETLDAKLREEEGVWRHRCAEKGNEIARFESESKARLDALAADIAARRQAWETANRQLGEQVQLLTKNLAALQQSWDEERTAKERDLAALRSNLAFWEQRAAAEEQKRLAAWGDERAAQEGKLAALTEELENVRRSSTAEIEENEAALLRMREESRRREDERHAAAARTETEFLERREKLAAELAGWEEKWKSGSARIEKERKEIEREIEKVKLESALKDTAALAERQKAERHWGRVRADLDERLAALAARLREEKENATAKLRIKEEEMKTLQVRLSLREERRYTEMKRREEETGTLIKELETELKDVLERCRTALPEKQEALARRSEELEALKSELLKREEQWRREQSERRLFVADTYDTLRSGMEQLGREIEEENRNFEQLFKAKELRIAELSAEMVRKEEALKGEHEHSREIVRFLRARAEEFRRSLLQSGRETPAAADGLRDLFDEAVHLYQGGDYAAARGKLEEILARRPDFTGAYQYIALCHWNMGNRREAKKYAERALELEPHNQELKFWIASIIE